jgi:SAM-dependent methyltransferase
VDISARQEIERAFWRDSEDESPDSDSLCNIVNKASDAEVFLECIHRHRAELAGHGRVLELGAGQGWASCAYKKLFPDAYMIVTDISEHAIMSLPKWERVFDTKVDSAYACKSYETQENDSSVDQAFCFAAAHHFLAHRRTLHEIGRILKPGGKAFYFHEPTTPKLLYGPAYRRVNRKRPEVPEDVLVTSRLGRLAHEAGLEMHVDYHPSLLKRGPFETVYYFVLSHLPLLQRLLPCSANIVFTKQKVRP